MSSPGILSSVPDLATVCALFTVLPVTVSSAECFFSKLKIIKTSGLPFRRKDSMVLALLAVENEAAKQHNTDDFYLFRFLAVCYGPHDCEGVKVYV